MTGGDLLSTLPDGYWNRTADVDTSEQTHPYVGRKIIVTNPDYNLLYNTEQTVIRAYERSDGVYVRCQYDKTGIITLKPHEYLLRKDC